MDIDVTFFDCRVWQFIWGRGYLCPIRAQLAIVGKGSSKLLFWIWHIEDIGTASYWHQHRKVSYWARTNCGRKRYLNSKSWTNIYYYAIKWFFNVKTYLKTHICCVTSEDHFLLKNINFRIHLLGRGQTITSTSQ